MTRRHITTAITMLVLVGIVGVAGIVGWKAVTEPMPGLTATKECHTESVVVTLKTSQVQVSVYNAGNRAGLAGDTMKALTRRGFIEGDLNNVNERVRNVEVRTSIQGSPEAKLVALQFGPKVKPIYSDVDLGRGIDVIVGNKFSGLKKNAKKKIKYTEDKQVCSGS